MMRVDRWRRWHPSMQKSADTTERGLTKLTEPTFVSFVSENPGRTANFSVTSQETGEAARAESFHRWMLERCTFQMRSFGGIGVLHRDFCDWSDAHDEPLAPRRIFEQLLAGAGLFQANGLVSGLILRDGLHPIKQAGQPQMGYRKHQENLRSAVNGTNHLTGIRKRRNDS